MEFPLLIKIESKQIAYIANSLDQLPINLNFKIVKSRVSNPENVVIDLPYKVVNDGICKCPVYFHEYDEHGNKHCRACDAEWLKEESTENDIPST